MYCTNLFDLHSLSFFFFFGDHMWESFQLLKTVRLTSRSILSREFPFDQNAFSGTTPLAQCELTLNTAEFGR